MTKTAEQQTLGACRSSRTEQSEGHFGQADSEILPQYRVIFG